jgi:hypothetical protein
MFVSAEEEQISLPSENAMESLKFDGISPVSEFHDAPTIPAIYTDVNVVPEHEKNELKELILHLEGRIFNK